MAKRRGKTIDEIENQMMRIARLNIDTGRPKRNRDRMVRAFKIGNQYVKNIENSSQYKKNIAEEEKMYNDLKAKGVPNISYNVGLNLLQIKHDKQRYTGYQNADTTRAVAAGGKG